MTREPEADRRDGDLAIWLTPALEHFCVPKSGVGWKATATQRDAPQTNAVIFNGAEARGGRNPRLIHLFQHLHARRQLERARRDRLIHLNVVGK